MSNPSNIGAREMFKITLCLTLTCLIAAIVLGGVYFFTEPAKRRAEIESESALVLHLLNLDSQTKIMEVRRYLSQTKDPRIGYLLSDSLDIYDVQGKAVRSLPIPASLNDAMVKDRWVEEHFPQSRFAGRFFIAVDSNRKPLGYVAESVQYGFKSPIRFFVALSPDFEIRGVDVVSHEEDPGLGSEITKPFFKDQFLGLKKDQLEQIQVAKGPVPKDSRDRAHNTIYAVTGATISSKALTEGIKKTVQHLDRRLQIVFSERGLHE